MNSERHWEPDYDRELQRAIQARSIGNEGLARVCARRAAAILVGEYLYRRGVSGLSNSVHDRLTYFITLSGVDENCKQICRHLLMKVNPDHHLPIAVDLIQEVIWLRNQLMREDYLDYAHTRNHQQ